MDHFSQAVRIIERIDQHGRHANLCGRMRIGATGAGQTVLLGKTLGVPVEPRPKAARIEGLQGIEVGQDLLQDGWLPHAAKPVAWMRDTDEGTLGAQPLGGFQRFQPAWNLFSDECGQQLSTGGHYFLSDDDEVWRQPPGFPGACRGVVVANHHPVDPFLPAGFDKHIRGHQAVAGENSVGVEFEAQLGRLFRNCDYLLFRFWMVNMAASPSNAVKPAAACKTVLGCIPGMTTVPSP